MGKILLGIIIGIGGVLALAYVAMKHPIQGRTGASSPVLCPVSSIEIKSFNAKWVDPCRRSSCASMQGAGTLVNACPIAAGVQLKMTGYDEAGNPIAARTLWPASIKNIEPGNYVFSLDQWLDYNPAIKRFEVSVESTRVWN